MCDTVLYHTHPRVNDIAPAPQAIAFLPGIVDTADDCARTSFLEFFVAQILKSQPTLEAVFLGLS